MSDDTATAGEVAARVEAELAAFDGSTRAGRMLPEDFARLCAWRRVRSLSGSVAGLYSGAVR